MIKLFKSMNGPFLVTARCRWCTFFLGNILLISVILNIVVKRLLQDYCDISFLLSFSDCEVIVAWFWRSLHIIFQTLTNAVTLVLLKWRNVILMPLALILRARTTAPVILKTLGMVFTVKVRLFFGHAFYLFRVGIG